MNRPGLLVAVAGTATEIGKTWVTAAVAAELAARGHRVSARKPVQSFDPDDHGPTDAEVLAAATGEAVDDVCPPAHNLPVAMAPPMAADVLGVPRLQMADLLGAVRWPSGIDVGFLETVGGVRSPVAGDGDSADLIGASSPDLVVLVADAALGTINAVRTATPPFEGLPVIVFLNRFDDDDLARRNRTWLADTDGYDVITTIAALATRLEPQAAASTTTAG